MERTYTADEQREHRKLWVEALRSGKYEQARGTLKDHRGGMCCLGVACDISGLGSWDGETYRNGRFVSESTPDDDIVAWLGLSTRRGSMTDCTCLTEQNDHGATFPEIADIIEAEPEGLIAK